MISEELLKRVKDNLIITFSDDDSLILSFVAASINYAESYQHLDEGYYQTNPMSATTKQAVVMLASSFYESRDGSTGGFFGNSTNANEQTWKTVNLLLRMDRAWKV